MKIKKILLICFILILIITGIFYFSTITGRTIKKQEYTYTKAICNESNYCQDYEITCKGEELIRTIPITGAEIENPENWEDPRDEKTINKLC